MKEKRKAGQPLEHFHTTRMVPKRAAELIDGGSLYWVIKGIVQARQRIVDVRPFVDEEGIGRCRLVLEPKVVPTNGSRSDRSRAGATWRPRTRRAISSVEGGVAACRRSLAPNWRRWASASPGGGKPNGEVLPLLPQLLTNSWLFPCMFRRIKG